VLTLKFAPSILAPGFPHLDVRLATARRAEPYFHSACRPVQ
jgi:hypothetical protein